jgi:4-hydroxy-2-oxoheptanedioate aldolase
VPLSDILSNNVKEKLARNEVVASMTVRLVRGIEIARIAKSAGFDSLYIDLEHSPLSIDATGQIAMAALALGIAPFVRVPANTPEYISRVLDAGALGVIAPGVCSPQQARAVVAAAKVRPARPSRRRRWTAAFALRQLPGRRGQCGDQRCDHGDRPIRKRRGD